MTKIKKNHRYTDEEIQFLMDNHKNMTVRELTEALNLPSTSSLRCKLMSLGLKAKLETVYSEDGTMKLCAKCKQFLPIDDFGVHYGKPRSRCRKCEYNNPNAQKSNRRIYTDEEVKFLKKHSNEYTYSELADIFNVGVPSIRAKLYGLGLKAKVKQVYSEDGTMKICSKCNKFFPIEEFKASENSALRSACKVCLYEQHLKRKKNLKNPNEKPSFDELIKNTKKGYKNCTGCGTLLNKDNCIIRTCRGKWEICPKCKPCVNKMTKERALKRIAERGY